MRPRIAYCGHISYNQSTINVHEPPRGFVATDKEGFPTNIVGRPIVGETRRQAHAAAGLDEEADACRCIDCSRRRRQLTAVAVVAPELDYTAAGLVAPSGPTRGTLGGTEWEEELQQRRPHTTYGPLLDSLLDPRRRLGDAVAHDAKSLQEDATAESASSGLPGPPTSIDWSTYDSRLATNPWRSPLRAAPQIRSKTRQANEGCRCTTVCPPQLGLILVPRRVLLSVLSKEALFQPGRGRGVGQDPAHCSP